MTIIYNPLKAAGFTFTEKGESLKALTQMINSIGEYERSGDNSDYRTVIVKYIEYDHDEYTAAGGAGASTPNLSTARLVNLVDDYVAKYILKKQQRKEREIESRRHAVTNALSLTKTKLPNSVISQIVEFNTGIKKRGGMRRTRRMRHQKMRRHGTKRNK